MFIIFRSSFVMKTKLHSIVISVSMLLLTVFFLQLLLSFNSTAAERPRWMDEEGIVMAGSWEAPAFRARRAGYINFKMPPEWIDGYLREHSKGMIDSLKSIGALTCPYILKVSEVNTLGGDCVDKSFDVVLPL